MENRKPALLVIDAEVLQAELSSTDPEHVIDELREYAEAVLEGRPADVLNPTGVVLVGSTRLDS